MGNQRYYRADIYSGTSERTFEQFLRFFKNCVCVCDYGCGPGNFLQLLSQSGITAEGYDPMPEARELARQKGLVVHEKNPDLSKFDGLMMFMVIEHMEIEEASDILNSLVSGTIVVIGTADPRIYFFNWKPFSYKKSFWDDPTHVRPYTPQTLKRLLIYCGYEILEQGRVRFPTNWYSISSKLHNAKLLVLEKLWGIMHSHYVVAKKR